MSSIELTCENACKDSMLENLSGVYHMIRNDEDIPKKLSIKIEYDFGE